MTMIETLQDLKTAIENTKGIHEKDLFGLLNKISLLEDKIDEYKRN